MSQASHIPWYRTESGIFVPGHGKGCKPTQNRPFTRLVRRATLGETVRIAVNKRLKLNYDWIPKYDQGAEGSCVGFAWSWAMSFLNRMFYAARKLYLEAQWRDIWGETPPEEGTSIDAGGIVLVEQGHWRFTRGMTWPAGLVHGIKGVQVAMTVDDVRYAIDTNRPVVLGIPWYEDFDEPAHKDIGPGGPRWWIGVRKQLGRILGWHAICLFGWRDDIGAASLVNNWGVDYPIVNMPGETLDRVLRESGGGLVPIDR